MIIRYPIYLIKLMIIIKYFYIWTKFAPLAYANNTFTTYHTILIKIYMISYR